MGCRSVSFVPRPPSAVSVGPASAAAPDPRRLPLASHAGAAAPAGGRVARRAPRRRPWGALAAVLACAAALGLSASAEAQRTVWEADLNARRFAIPGSGTGANHGCYNVGVASIGCGNTNRLTDDDFTLGGVSYSVTRLAVDQNGELTIAFDPDPPDAFDNLVLVLDSDRFPLEDADDSVAEARSWSGTGLSWTFGTDVAVALELPEPVAACDGDEAPAGAFWTSCVTVGDLTGGLYGYTFGIGGSLDDTTFDRDGAEHVIARLFGRAPQYLDFGFTATPSSSASGWTLQVGSESFALSAATYHIAVFNYNWAVNSAVIDSGDLGNKITVSLRPPEPGAPTGLTAAGSSATQIDLSWTAPAYAGASAITGYKIEVSTDGSTWTDLAANTASTTTSYDHTGLSANDVRHYRVSAINTQGTGPASDSVRATARGDTTAPTVSSAAVTSAGNRLNLIFSEAMDQTFANEPALTAFRVTAGGFFVPLLEIGAGTSGTSRAVNLARTIKSGQTVRVSYTDPTAADDTKALQDAAGNDVATFADQTVTNNSTVAAVVPEKALFLTADPMGSNQIDLSWGPGYDGGSAVTSYKIEVSTDGTSFTDLVASTGNTDTTYSHTGLTGGTTRHYRVSAINTVGTGAVSDVANATTSMADTAPGIPTGLSATAVGHARIDLSWTAPSSDGGSAVTGYKIEVSSDGGTTFTDLAANTGNTGTNYSHTGLAAGTTRHYRVSAINSVGTGNPSNLANATTGRQSEPPPPLATVPGAATGLSATSAGQSRIDLSWIAPSNDGGAAVTGYRIEVSPDGQTWSDLVADTGSTGTTYSHTGLSPGTTRYYRVLAINSVGTGNPSNLANATTERESEPPRLPTLSVPPTEAVESDESAVFEVRLSKASSEVVTVDYETSDGDGGAKAGSDYTATAGTLELAPGSTAGRIRVPVLNDELYEVDSETFTLVLRRPVNATFGDGGSVLRVAGTIHDDDGGSPTADFEVDGAACEDDLCSARTGVPVKFVDTSTGKVLSRLWDFGDGTTSRFHTGSHSWPSAGFYEVTLAVSDGETTSTASRVFRVEASEPQGTCSGDAETLCLQDSRFAVNVEWRKANGDGGDGPVVPRGTNDSGLFTFFDRDNWEILIKVLDGCAVNGHMWVYGASATTVGYLVTVTDTVTGEVREYGNEPGMRADAITDATAFAGACASPPGNASTPDGSVLRTDEDGTIVQEAIRPATGSSEEEEAVCTETPTTLCLQGGRYAVSAEWSTPEDSGAAPTVRARTPDSGLFYFFTPGNWEMLVKVLDGCSYNDHHWVFAASATDVGFVLTVRDTQTGLVKQYRKEPGRPARAVADIGALPLGCEP